MTILGVGGGGIGGIELVVDLSRASYMRKAEILNSLTHLGIGGYRNSSFRKAPWLVGPLDPQVQFL
jgi:hypothetical protein